MGVGAVLTQNDPFSQKHVISYASRCYFGRGKIYSATEIGALAVTFASDHFHAYLSGRFTLVTNHGVLHWLYSLEPKFV